MRFLPILWALVMAATPVFGQSDAWYLDKPIADVQFTGLRRVAERDLRGVVRPFIGKPLSAAVLADLERRLLDLEYFDALTPSPVEGPDGQASVIIRYTVVERPSYAAVRFDGNTVARSTDLLEVIKIKPGDTVSRVKAREAQAALLTYYVDKGFTRAQVDYAIEEIAGRPSSRNLVFTITEGYRTTIRSIRFSGNSYASASTLRGLLESKEQSLLNPGTYTEANFELDKEKLLSWYRNNGFIDARIVDILREQTPDEKDKREYLTLTFVIEEGSQYNFGGFTIVGNQVFNTEELLALTKSRIGLVANFGKIQADYQAVVGWYYDRGYAFNQWNLVETRDEETKTISWTIEVKEGGLAYIGDVQIRGNVKTKLEIIERELPFKKGDIFSSQKLREGYLALMNTRYFSSVLPEPSIMSDGLILITITVVEQNTIDVRVGGSLSGDEDFPLSFIGRFADVNFLGEGRNFSIDLNLSGKEQTISTQIYDGWLFGEELGGGISLNLSNATKTTVDLVSSGTSPGGPGLGFETTYLDYTNINLGLGVNLSKTWRTDYGRINLSGGAGTEMNYLAFDERVGIPADVKLVENQEKLVLINNLSVGTSFDSRDIFYNPSKGFYASAKATLYGGFLFGARDYIQTDTTLQGWFPLWDIPVLDWGNITTSLGVNSSMSTLWPQFWTASGNNYAAGERALYIQPMAVARGWYNWATILPEVQTGGKVLWNNWAELRTPVIPQVLSFDVFFDAVRLVAEREDVFTPSPQGWLFGTGAGLRLAMQGLPLRLYLGKRFSLDDDGSVLWQRGSLFSGPEGSTDGLDLILAISLF